MSKQKTEKKLLSSEFRKNLAVFSLVIGIFLLIAVLSTIAILVARGERPTRDGIVGTGTIRVNTEPSSVDVFLNDRPVSVQDKLITNINPGTYVLRLAREGYTPWEREIKIRAGIVEDVSIRLLPAELEISQVTRSNVDKVTFADNSDFAYYVVKSASRGEDIGIWRQRIADVGALNFFGGSTSPTKISNLIPNIIEDFTDGDYEIIPSRDNQRILVRAGSEFYILNSNTYNEPDASNNLNELLAIEVPYQKASWLRGSESLLLETAEFIAEFEISSQELKLIKYKSEETLPYVIAENQVYYVNSDLETGKSEIFSYTSGRRERVRLDNTSINGVIEVLWANPANASSIIYRNSDNSFHYLNLENSYQVEIDNATDVLAVNRNGKNIIFGDTEGGSFVFSIRELRSLGEFETSIVPLPENSDINRSKFSNTGGNLFFLAETGALIIADPDGSNQVELISSEAFIVNGGFNTNINETRLFVLLSENISEEPGDDEAGNEIIEMTNNLYMVDLIN